MSKNDATVPRTEPYSADTGTKNRLNYPIDHPGSAFANSVSEKSLHALGESRHSTTMNH